MTRGALRTSEKKIEKKLSRDNYSNIWRDKKIRELQALLHKCRGMHPIWLIAKVVYFDNRYPYFNKILKFDVKRKEISVDSDRAEINGCLQEINTIERVSMVKNSSIAERNIGILTSSDVLSTRLSRVSKCWLNRREGVERQR